jgi:hypothetical protein
MSVKKFYDTGLRRGVGEYQRLNISFTKVFYAEIREH